ncbi:zinc finger protein 276 [Antennarius striatus]|uniref:zinc finger protein 276 n=1 Tax=Antennarius striatus TaxID=241820 RepID=UPI0035B4C2B1
MKKRSRLPRSSSTTVGVGDKRPPGNRGRPRKTLPVTSDRFCLKTAKAKTSSFCVAAVDQSEKHPESKHSGRLTTAVCRLCHGKFSPRSLRHAFQWPQDPAAIVGDESEDTTQSPLLFHTDFQQLVGVQLDRDPQLSEFICKKCHTKFYKCHSILSRFLQRVNLTPVGTNMRNRKNAKPPESLPHHDSHTPSSFSSDPKCLHSLVSWAHHHGESCHSCPDLKEVHEGQCWGSVKAVWGCVNGHRYIMDTQCSTKTHTGCTMNFTSDALGSANDEGVMSEEEDKERKDEEEQPSRCEGVLVDGAPAQQISPAVTAPAQRTGNTDGQEEARSPAPEQLEDRADDGNLSDRVVSDDDFEDRKEVLSDTELFEPYTEKRARRGAVTKRRQNQKAPEEPKVKKKPGPKPGWKNKFKPKGEELPNIYKCPYQGCTAVYRAPDGLKKHIKEHHEEVRERPCPHPGCNKVFMIDRYLQRHVKLIHTEERNYICDQCGQTFKQRKHLSVHQMRHSGAKPLQCEVCGFQCRQRASLKYHMTKHKAEADLEFACLICGKRFEKAHNLNVHMSMVHPLTQEEPQRGSSRQQQPLYDLHTISLTGEVVQQDQDR